VLLERCCCSTGFFDVRLLTGSLLAFSDPRVVVTVAAVVVGVSPEIVVFPLVTLLQVSLSAEDGEQSEVLTV